MKHILVFGILPMFFAMMNISKGIRIKHEVDIDPCTRYSCENGGVCMKIVTRKEKYSGMSAQCKCSEQFSGQRCEHEIHLKSISTTWTSAKLQISLIRKTSSRISYRSNNYFEHRNPRFTLLHWANKTLDGCSLVPVDNPEEHVIENLQSDLEYRICAISGSAELCKMAWHFNSSSAAKSNCVVVRTAKVKEEPDFPVYLIVITVLSIVFLIVVCMFIAILMKRRNKTFFGRYLPCSRSNRKHASFLPKRHKNDDSRDIFLPPLPLNCDPPENILINAPASPGRPKHKLTESVRGTTSTFSAKNNKAIPLTTVLEYVPNEQMDDSESTLIQIVHRP